MFIACGNVKRDISKSAVPATEFVLVGNLYISPVSNIVAAHNRSYCHYADDTQLYMSVRLTDDCFMTVISECANDVTHCSLTGLFLNPTRNDALQFSSAPECQPTWQTSFTNSNHHRHINFCIPQKLCHSCRLVCNTACQPLLYCNSHTAPFYDVMGPSSKKWNFMTKFLVNFRKIYHHFKVSRVSRNRKSWRFI